MSRLVKEMELNTVRRELEGVKDCVILEPNRVDSATDYNVRKRLREESIRFLMVKNTLARKALSEQGIELKAEVWNGPTLVAWGKENLKELSKTIEKLLKDLNEGVKKKEDEKFQVKTAVADGHGVTLEEAKKMPTRQDAIATLLSAITAPGRNLAAALVAPGSQLAGALNAPGARLASQIKQIGEKEEQA